MITPTFNFEEQFWQQGITFIAGIDEVGMGALAGPVVAAAVIIDPTHFKHTPLVIRDSKTMSALQREKAYSYIQEHATAWAIAEATIEEITKLNIRGAAHLAMRRAVEALKKIPDLLLVDGNPVQIHPTIPSSNIIKGDSLSLSIASASILAKVHRDNIMSQLDKEFPMYGFAGNKGYGSKNHLDALRTYGATSWHRPSYAPIKNLTPAKVKQRL